MKIGFGRFRALLRKGRRLLSVETGPSFANNPEGFEMSMPRQIVHPEFMRIGNKVKVGSNSVLKCQTQYPGAGWMRHPEGRHVSQVFHPELFIGDRVTATASLQVVVFQSVVIEADVMFASNVLVSDGTHAFGNVDVPYKYQGIAPVAPVRIGRGSWVGQNVVILPGVTVGEMAIIGANSVVTRDVPPRTVVAGIPAMAIRRWNEENRDWERVQKN